MGGGADDDEADVELKRLCPAPQLLSKNAKADLANASYLSTGKGRYYVFLPDPYSVELLCVAEKTENVNHFPSLPESFSNLPNNRRWHVQVRWFCLKGFSTANLDSFVMPYDLPESLAKKFQAGDDPPDPFRDADDPVKWKARWKGTPRPFFQWLDWDIWGPRLLVGDVNLIGGKNITGRRQLPALIRSRLSKHYPTLVQYHKARLARCEEACRAAAEQAEAGFGNSMALVPFSAVPVARVAALAPSTSWRRREFGRPVGDSSDESGNDDPSAEPASGLESGVASAAAAPASARVPASGGKRPYPGSTVAARRQPSSAAAAAAPARRLALTWHAKPPIEFC
jgi:hypothetical protein